MEEICDAFIAEDLQARECIDPEKARKACIQVSANFIRFLKKQSGIANVIRCVRLIGLPEYCPEYYAPDNKDASHDIVYVDGFFVDWTLRQYIEDAKVPTIHEDVAALLNDWREVCISRCIDDSYGENEMQ